jgi:hypothetical protein
MRILPLLIMLIALMVVTYIVWFKWEWLAQVTIRANHDNPLFELYGWFYSDGLGKWFLRIVLVPIMWLFLIYILYHIVK